MNVQKNCTSCLGDFFESFAAARLKKEENIFLCVYVPLSGSRSVKLCAEEDIRPTSRVSIFVFPSKCEEIFNGHAARGGGETERTE
jgi:hypothetical protein